MKGIAIIIPNADFSNSPLGKVTRTESNAQKALRLTEEYAIKVGDSSYNNSINKLIFNMLENNIWDKTERLYPMLGTTLSQQTIDLKSLDDKKNLVIMENGKAGNNKITYSNKIEISPLPTENPFIFDFRNFSILINFKRIKTGVDINSSCVFGVGSRNVISTASLDGLVSPIFSAQMFSSGIQAKGVDSTVNHDYLFYGKDNNSDYLYVDNVLSDSNTGIVLQELDLIWYGHLGASGDYQPTQSAGSALSDANDKLFSGEINYFALGKPSMTKSDAINLHGILSDFTALTGK